MSKETRNDNGELHSFNDLPAIVYSDGTKIWYKDGLVHRDNDLPAVIMSDGTKKWCKNGLVHRDNDLPAIINYNGTMIWYRNGKLHRDTGPAIIFNDGTKSYFLKHIEYSFHEWLKLTSLSEEQKLYLVLEHEYN